MAFWGLAACAAAAHGQSPSLVASSSTAVNAAAVTVGRPAGVAQDDVLIAQITVKGARTVTPPGALGDWTLVNSTSTTGSDMTQAVFWRRVGVLGAEPASYAFSFSGSDRATGAVAAYRNVDPLGNPLDAAGVRSSNGAASISLPAVTTTQPNALLVALLGSSRAGNAHGIATGMTSEVYELDSAGGPNGVNASLDLQVQASAGSTGAKTATMSANTDYVAHLLALRRKPTLAHYAITVSSATAATCDYVEVTITGHDSSGTLVAPPANRSLSVSTSPASGAWQAGVVSGTGAWTPSGASGTYLWPGGESAFTVRLRQYSAATLNVNLNDGSGLTEDPSEDPSIAFIASAFRVSDGAGAALPIGTQISGKPSNTGYGAQNLYLQALGSNGSGACATLLPTNTDVAVEVGAQCNNPASCPSSVTLTSAALAGNTATFQPDGGYPATMNFRFTTANSEAAFALNYPDAGQITLQFRVQIPGSSPAQYVQGASNAFVVRPFGLAFPGIGHANTASGGVLAAAGDNFSMTLTAYRWASGEDADNDGVPDSGVNITDNGTTPNFAATATVSATANLAGVAGTVSRGATCATVPATIALVGGTATASDWCYSEVGNVLLSATATSYLGSGQDVTGSSALDGDTANGPYVGRFRPKRFALSNVSLTTRSDLACAPASSFTYMDETLRLGLRLTAQNAQGATTQNYTGASYAKLGVGTFANWNFGARSGAINLGTRIDSGVAPSGGWSNGVADMTFTTAILRASPDSPDGPFAALQFGIAPTDSDGTAMDTLDLDVDSAGGNDHKDLGLSTDVRFGRLRLDNALGAEARRLPVAMRVEYWNGSGFATNTADNCTAIPRSAIALDFTPVSNLTACETAVDSAMLTFASGVAPLALAAPGAGNSGSVVLSVNLGSAAGTYCPATAGATAAATSVAMPYLLGRWNDAADPDSNASTAYDDKPSARAAFGLYGSQPGNFIYFRERY